MLNKYPLWKNLMIIAILVIGGIYALPNLYGENQAIQISGSKGITLTMLLPLILLLQLLTGLNP